MSDTINEIPVTETKTDTEPPAVGTSTIGPDANKLPPAPEPSMKARKNMDKQQKKLMKYIMKMRKNQYKANGKVSKELNALKKIIGVEDYEAIVAVATTFHHEEKDKDGKVTKEAYNQTNWQAVIVEAKNLLVLRREKRMKGETLPDGTVVSPKRKRTTGRSSDRKAHKAKYAFIVKRGQEAIDKKEEVAGTVQV